MKAAWATDIHLRFADEDERATFYREIVDSQCDALLLTGDIGGECDLEPGHCEPLPATETLRDLRELAEAVGLPIYFVLGNHDYYRSSLAIIRRAVRDLCRQIELLHLVEDEGVVPLTSRTALVGHECWGDTGWGDFAGSQVMVSDWRVIWELKQFWSYADPSADLIRRAPTNSVLDRSALAARLKALGQESADHLRKVLPEALAHHRRVIVLCHVPPFLKGHPKKWDPHSEDHLPTGICRAAGDVLLEMARQFPDCQLDILAGHVHDRQRFQVTENMTMSIGSAELMAPRIESMIDVE